MALTGMGLCPLLIGTWDNGSLFFGMIFSGKGAKGARLRGLGGVEL